MAVTVESASIVYFSGNPIWFECESDQLGVVDNLKMECLIQLHNQPAVYRTARIYESVNASAKFLFNIGPIIDAMLKDWFDVPDFAVPSKICPIGPFVAELSFIEIYDGAEQEQDNQTTIIVHGGLRPEELDTVNDWWTTFELWADGDQTKIPFLTNKPLISTWKPGQPEFLYYYNYLSGSTSDLKMKIEYFDNNDASIDIDEIDLNDVPKNRIAQFNVGKLMQDRYFDPTSDAYYKIWLTRDSDIVSEVRTYYIDREYYPNLRYLAFENKKGGFDTVALTGDDNVGGFMDGAFVGKDYLRGQHIVDGLRTVTKRKLDRKIKKNSGWLTKLERKWLIELLESKQVYEVIGYATGTFADAVLLPVILDVKDLPPVASNEFISGFLIEWTF